MASPSSTDSRPADGWPADSSEAAVATVGQMLDRGEPLAAYDRVQAALLQWPGHTRLRQLKGLALARGGDITQANEILGELAREGVADAETLGMLARTCKDLGLRAKDAPVRTAHLAEAFRLYEKAFESARQKNAESDALYGGINAATMAVLLGDLPRARRIATVVREIGRRIAADSGTAVVRYWREATLGEAALILGDAAGAQRHYGQAAQLAQQRYGDVGSTRKQARLLAQHLPDIDPVWFAALEIPPVLVFTGNMIDRTDRLLPRFPPAIEVAVWEELRARINAMKPVAAYGSAACGTDILCLELVREAGGETHIVLPFPPEEFRKVSVDFAGADWGGRFDRALAAADSVTITSEHRASQSSATWEYANLVLTGMGGLRAQSLGTALKGLVVWDPSAPGAAGGSASLLQTWRTRGLDAVEVNLSRLRGEKDEKPYDPSSGSTPAWDLDPDAMRHEIRSLLFADAKGYSKLSEDQIPLYVAEFLGAVGQLNKRTTHRFEHVETAGDALYIVFRDASDAGQYALELNAVVNERDWAAVGLPASLKLRIALHSGPVFCGRDPVTGAKLVTGPHTSRTAGIEPITPPGQVYASAAFAAVAAATGADNLALRYVGRLPLAKGRGLLSLYHVDGVG